MYATEEERLRARKESRKRWADKNNDRVREIGRKTYRTRMAKLSDEEKIALRRKTADRVIAKYRSDPEYREKHKKNSREWTAKNRKKCRLYGKDYREKNREKLKNRRRKHYPDNLNKSRAHCAISKAIKDGTLIKPEKCQCCDKKKPLEGHHHKGYDVLHQLDVVWLCKSCHKIVEPPNGKYH